MLGGKEIMDKLDDSEVLEIVEGIFAGDRKLRLCEHCGEQTKRARAVLCARCSKKQDKFKSAYGITLKDFRVMQEAQRDRCAICDGTEPRGHGTWHVDHCHESEEVRGLLCQPCNLGLGFFQHSPEALRAAATYIETGGFQ